MLAWSGNDKFCEVATSINCKSTGLFWSETYEVIPKDLSKNLCKGEATTLCRLPALSSECPANYYLDATGAIAKTLYKCIPKELCETKYFNYENTCYNSCPTNVGLTTPIVGTTTSAACEKCNAGCKACANYTSAGKAECTGCFDGYFLNSTAKTCTSCSAIPNCKLCDSTSVCTSCVSGYLRIAGTGTSPKDSCLSCLDFKPYCDTCIVDTAGKVSDCSKC